jgi:hypothetical protein
MLQREKGWMHGLSDCCAVQAEGCEETLIRRLALLAAWRQHSRNPVAAGLAWAGDHGVHRVENDGEQHPEDGGEEETAHDLAYGMGLEEAG